MKNLLEPARGVGIESHRNPWNLMESHGISWNLMESHGISWNLMESPRKIRLFQHIFWRTLLSAVEQTDQNANKFHPMRISTNFKEERYNDQISMARSIFEKP